MLPDNYQPIAKPSCFLKIIAEMKPQQTIQKISFFYSALNTKIYQIIIFCFSLKHVILFSTK